MRFVTCGPTMRPAMVKMITVTAKKKDVASAASSPIKFIFRCTDKKDFLLTSFRAAQNMLFEVWYPAWYLLEIVFICRAERCFEVWLFVKGHEGVESGKDDRSVYQQTP